MSIIAGIVVILASLAGALLTMFMLPGLWLIVLVALVCQWWQGWDLYSWTTLGIAVGLGVAAEVFEVVASAVGAKKAGGTRRGAIGSIIGAVVGAIVGSFIVPIVGTVIGGALGAGLGALVAERHGGRMSWGDSAMVGGGAAAGRLFATLVKVFMTVVVGVILCVGAFVR